MDGAEREMIDRLSLLVGLVGSSTFFLACLCTLLIWHSYRISALIHTINWRLSYVGDRLDQVVEELECANYLDAPAEQPDSTETQVDALRHIHAS